MSLPFDKSKLNVQCKGKCADSYLSPTSNPDISKNKLLDTNRIYDGVEAEIGNLRLVFRLFSLMRSLPIIRLK